MNSLSSFARSRPRSHVSNHHRVFLSSWCCTLALLAAATNGIQAGQLQAGVARVDLTPPLEMKAALGGYGARDSKPATGVHDAVWAKALFLKDGSRKFVLVTADVLAFPHLFKGAVVERLSSQGWTANQILLLPSHSHTSIDMMAIHPGNTFQNRQVGLFQKDLYESTANKLAQLVVNAGKDLVPVRAGSARISIPDRNRNRRGLAIRDQDLTVTRIDTENGKPLAALINWTAHPTFMSEDDMLFSGDWPGHLQRTMEALVGQGVTAMFYNGAEGDQSPVPPAASSSRWERAERYGREMGIASWRLWERIQPREIQKFAYGTETIPLPKRQWHPDFMKTGGAEYGLDDAKMQGFVDQLNPTQTWSTSLELGDLLIVGIPGEMAAQLGMEIKSKAQPLVPCPTIGGLADEWVSYILPAEEYRKGGYEASMSFYGETLGNTIVTGALRNLDGLKKVE